MTKMALKQREANQQALEMAAAMVRDADFDSLFSDIGDGSEKDDEVLAKAQAYAVRRIEGLRKKHEPKKKNLRHEWNSGDLMASMMRDGAGS